VIESAGGAPVTTRRNTLAPVKKMTSKISVKVGRVTIGGGAPISIQSMCNADPSNSDAVAAQVIELADAGCDIVRVAVPTMDHVGPTREVRRLTRGVPLVADVHFDHRVAIALCGCVDKIRLNPGTMEHPGVMHEVARALIDTGTPVRIGMNSGSLPRGSEDIDKAVALVDGAARWIDGLRDLGVTDIVVSVKSSSPATTIRAYELASSRFDLPLHVGVTESGTATSGAIRSATVLGSLLGRGIGDTIRVSLAGPPIPEVRAAAEILSSLGLRAPGMQIRACPGCGRARMDTGSVATRIEAALNGCDRAGMILAVMGCEVNGPGEARDATLAIVGTARGAAVYEHGHLVSTGAIDDAMDVVIEKVLATPANEPDSDLTWGTPDSSE